MNNAETETQNANSDEKRRKKRRLRKWKEFEDSSGDDRSDGFALSEIERMADSLDISDTSVNLGKQIYKSAAKKDLIHGRPIEALAAAALYIGSRQMDTDGDTRSLDEIASTTSMDSGEVGRTYRYLCRELDMGIDPAEPQEYVSRYVAELNRSWLGEGRHLSENVIEKALEVIEVADDAGLVAGKSPSGYAAAAIYTAARELGEDVTQAELANVFDGSEVTIRQRYKEQVEVGVAEGILSSENFEKVLSDD